MKTRFIRQIRIDGDRAFIPLTKGYEAVIDVEDVCLVEDFNWLSSVCKNVVYAMRASPRKPNTKRKFILLHRVLTSAPAHLQVDHIDSDGLNNRRSNLRLATVSQNHFNSRISKRNTSGFKGVSFEKRANKWLARIKIDGKVKWLGYYNNPEDAGAAYAKASPEVHGNFGRVA